MNEWISVKDRLPDKDMDIWIYGNNAVKAARSSISYCVNDDFSTNKDEIFSIYFFIGYTMISGVTHWMPRVNPKPPNKG